MGGIANGIAYHGGFIPYCGTFLDVQRLHARLGPAGRAVRAPRHLRLDPRLGRARRGRPDPPAGRALRRAAGDPEPVVHPAGRRQRDVGRLGGGDLAPGRTGRAVADPPEAGDAARDGRAGAGRRRPGRLRPARVERRPRGDRPDPDRHRLGAAARRGGRGVARPPKAIRTRVVSLPCWELFELQPATYRDDGPAAGRPQAAQRRGRRVPRLGALRRRRGRDRRDRPLRRERPGRDDLRALRVHRRSRRRRRPAGRARRAPRPRSRRSTRPPAGRPAAGRSGPRPRRRRRARH